MSEVRRPAMTYAWTAMLLLTIVVPLYLVALQYGRFADAKANLQAAADAAALAAVAEVDVPVFQRSGRVVLRDSAYGAAQAWANRTLARLPGARDMQGVVVERIDVDNACRCVRVTARGTVSALFGLSATVRATGVAQVRAEIQ